MKRIPLKAWFVIIFLAIFAIIAVILTVFFRDLVRDQVVMPLLEAYRFLRQLVKSLDSDLLWGVFILALYISILISLPSLGRSAPQEGTYIDKRSRSGRLRHWLNEVYQLKDERVITRYATIELKKLILNTVAFRQQCSLRQAERWLTAPENQRQIPAEVQRLMQLGHGGIPESNTFWQALKAWLLRYPSLPKIDQHIDLEPILRFLESEDGKQVNIVNR